VTGSDSYKETRIAFVTIGQAPRPDIVPDIVGMLDISVAHDEFGALDGLTRDEIGLHPPPPGGRSLYTRLADGSHIETEADFVEDRLQELMGRLDTRGYELIVLISTGVFRPIHIATPLVHGQRAVDAWIAALVMGDCRIGVIYPLDQQTRTSPKHGLLIQNARFAAATGDAGTLADAASRLTEADFVLMHSVGYTEVMAREVAMAAGRPVVTARRIIAGAMRLHLEAATAETPQPQLGVSGREMVERLPSPAHELTRREHEILCHVLEGRSNKAIGRVLGISHRTVEIHRARAMAKFGTGSTTELVRWSMIGRGR
jgi:DNA-binding CsgD family transcriptional regulator